MIGSWLISAILLSTAYAVADPNAATPTSPGPQDPATSAAAAAAAAASMGAPTPQVAPVAAVPAASPSPEAPQTFSSLPSTKPKAPEVQEVIKVTVKAPSTPKLSAAEIENNIRNQVLSSTALTRDTIAFLSKIRDPFGKPELTVTRTTMNPLEQFPVEQLELIGVITGPERVRALIRTPDGKTHIVFEKAKLGNNGGIVRAISSVAVSVREKIRNELLGEEEVLDKEIRLNGRKSKDGSG